MKDYLALRNKLRVKAAIEAFDEINKLLLEDYPAGSVPTIHYTTSELKGSRLGGKRVLLLFAVSQSQSENLIATLGKARSVGILTSQDICFETNCPSRLGNLRSIIGRRRINKNCTKGSLRTVVFNTFRLLQREMNYMGITTAQCIALQDIRCRFLREYEIANYSR